MIKEDGEKYACDSCIRGHRVSQCQHTDRELHHINRKGRPVSQCPHCRGLRKSKATHVRCTCGEKTGSPDESQCACMTGNRCVCATKKEDHSGSEDGSRPPSRLHIQQHAPHKPPMSSRKSETSIPRIRNGHHPPMHRLNNAAHEAGLPYQVKRLNSVGVSLTLPSQPLDPIPSTKNLPTTIKGVATLASEHGSPVEGTAQPFIESALPVIPYEATPFNVDFRPLAEGRYSMDDFADYLNNEPLECVEQAPIMSANLEQGFFDWNDYNITTPFTLSGFAEQVPPLTASSTVSQDQPCLSRSSSDTLSDGGHPLPIDILSTAGGQVIPNFDTAWMDTSSFVNENDFAMPMPTQQQYPEFQMPSSSSSYPASFSDLSSSASYFSQNQQQQPAVMGLGVVENKWLSLTPEPFIPQRLGPATNGYFDDGSLCVSSFQQDTNADAAAAVWPVALAYDFSEYNNVSSLEDDELNVGQSVGSSWL